MQIKINTKSNKYFYWIIIVLTFIIYGNAINNEYSLDDNIIIDRDDNIINRGFKSIPKIFRSRYAKDKEQSYDYRPITTVSFAIEKQFFKGLPTFQTKEQKEKKDKLTQANISHFINILLYAITCILIFQLLSVLFDSYHVLLSFVITLIFIVHPLHTEVVANIKSRDELLMFLFMLLSIKHYLKFEMHRKYKYILFAGVFMLLSVLSKKNGLGLIGVLPVIMYFKKYNWKRFLFVFLTFAVVFVAFKFIGRGIISKESIRHFKYFENPLLVDGGTIFERISVGLYCSLFYLKMLIFPYKMSYYYGYNQIPMATWSYWQVWAALLIYVPLMIYGGIQFLKRKAIGLGILLWLGLMLPVINILMPMVGIVADRFTYSLSLGFCIVFGLVLFKLFKLELPQDQVKINLPNSFLSVFAFILILYSGRTIIRNPDWHDYLHLYVHDIDNVEESAKAHALIANTLYPFIAKNPMDPRNPQYVQDIITHYHRALEIDSTYLTTYCNLGSAYIDMVHDYQKGIYYSKIAVSMDNEYLEATLNLAVGYEKTNQLDSAFKYNMRGVEIDPDRPMTYNVVNRFLTKYNMVEQGIKRLNEIALNAKNPKFIYTDMANLYSLDNTKIDTTILFFEKAFNIDKTDQKLCNHLKNLYSMQGNNEKVNFYSQYCN